MEPYDFLAIGDTVVDDFIRLKEATVSCDMNHEHCTLGIPFGAKVPFEFAKTIYGVGNAANASVAAARLGLRTALVTSVGDDEHGKRCMDALTASGVSGEFIKQHEGLHTNYHYVLWYEQDRTILIKHEEFPYDLPQMAPPRWLYFSSLRQGSEAFHDVIGEYLVANPSVNFAFQPGVFDMRMGVERLKTFYERAAVFFCNREEAQLILGAQSSDIQPLLDGIRGLGPKIVVITDGPNGAYVKNDEGSWFMPVYPDPKPPYERTGAGDAFSATFTAALALGLPVTDAMRWAPVNSMSVVQAVGAQEGLLGKEALLAWLEKAPVEYVAKQL